MQMVDLKNQYLKIKSEIDEAVLEVIGSTKYIKGPAVKLFEHSLSEYLDVKHVIGCANGTDALQVALMALGLESGDEIIVPSFTYVATAEVIALLKLKPIMVDVDPISFNVTPDIILKALTKRTKAIVPVHLFGQSCDMEGIMKIANDHNLYVIEDSAQSIGANYKYSSGETKKVGTIGHIGCTSFFPSKNLGCYGDGGAIFTNDDHLATRIKMIANHGQSKRYYHDEIGVNSRLDSIQAAILNVKLKYLDHYNHSRRQAADYYSNQFSKSANMITPSVSPFSDHVYHQYTLQLSVESVETEVEGIAKVEVDKKLAGSRKDNRRDALSKYLMDRDIPHGIYYPVPLYKQKAYAHYYENNICHPTTERLCNSVISLPMHSELNYEIQDKIIHTVMDFIDQ